MKMTLSTADAVNLARGILLYRSVPEQWPTRLNHLVNLNFKALKNTHDAYNELLNELSERYCERDADNKPVMINNDPNRIKLKDPAAFTRELREAEKVEVDLELVAIPLKDLPEKFPANVQAGIDLLITDDGASNVTPIRPVASQGE